MKLWNYIFVNPFYRFASLFKGFVDNKKNTEYHFIFQLSFLLQKSKCQINKQCDTRSNHVILNQNGRDTRPIFTLIYIAWQLLVCVCHNGCRAEPLRVFIGWYWLTSGSFFGPQIMILIINISTPGNFKNSYSVWALLSQLLTQHLRRPETRQLSTQTQTDETRKACSPFKWELISKKHYLSIKWMTQRFQTAGM